MGYRIINRHEILQHLIAGDTVYAIDIGAGTVDNIKDLPLGDIIDCNTFIYMLKEEEE